MTKPLALALCAVTIILALKESGAILCYQCDSKQDNTCPPHPLGWFDRNINALVDCSTDEAWVPGTMCMKQVQKSPGWYGWQKQLRRCGSASEIGVSSGCAFGYEDEGVYIERCYCNTDGCNGAVGLARGQPLLVAVLAALLSVTAAMVASGWLRPVL